MENYKLVMPHNLNQFGYLFGGDLLKWVDEYAWIAASFDFPGNNFVTIGMDKVEFIRSVKKGTILVFDVLRHKVGNTSVQYAVDVYRDHRKDKDQDLIFSTHVAFVCIGENGEKKEIIQKDHN